MEKFCKKYNLPKLIKEEIEYCNILMSVEDIECIIKNQRKKQRKVHTQMTSLVIFSQPFKDKITKIIHNLFQIIEKVELF